jgi:hypothetical protein
MMQERGKKRFKITEYNEGEEDSRRFDEKMCFWCFYIVSSFSVRVMMILPKRTSEKRNKKKKQQYQSIQHICDLSSLS